MLNNKNEQIKNAALNGEEIREVEGIKNLYASNFGRLFKFNYKGILQVKKPYISKAKTKPYYRTIHNGVDYSVSRIIAHTFINSELPLTGNKSGNKLVVDHINGDDTLNNSVNNLQIITQSDNLKKKVREIGSWSNMKNKECYSYNIWTHEYKKYNTTGELVNDIWKKTNNGYFNKAYINKFLIQGRFVIGYDLDDLKDLAFLKRCNLAKTQDQKIQLFNERFKF